MVRIDLAKLHRDSDILAHEYMMISRIANSDWTLRRTKPYAQKPISYHCACATYIWRMTAFYLSKIETHQTQPFWAFMYLPNDLPDEDFKILVERLNFLVNKIIQTVPVSEWYGVNRWRSMHE